MGHIVPRKRGGKVVHREAQTFDRRQAANAWMARRETELSKPGAIERARQAGNDPKLRDVIDRYTDESEREIGRTKAQVLRTIKGYDIAELRCSQITSADVVSFVQAIAAGPATRQNYLSHLGAIFTIARPAWGYPLDPQTIEDAFAVTKRLGVTAKGKSRDQRPTLNELDHLMVHFGEVKTRRPKSIPMQKIIAFAIFSTRRQEEIVRIRWQDFEAAHNGQPARILVRDMKHPGEKLGNDTWCELTPEAAAIIESMPRTDDRIFPYSTDAVGAAFTRACYTLDINTEDMQDEKRLYFHDLRHEGVSRLFEMGRNIPQAASVSGHRSWSSLKRYSHLRQTGDKYANWKWCSLWTPLNPAVTTPECA